RRDGTAWVGLIPFLTVGVRAPRDMVLLAGRRADTGRAGRAERLRTAVLLVGQAGRGPRRPAAVPVRAALARATPSPLRGRRGPRRADPAGGGDAAGGVPDRAVPALQPVRRAAGRGRGRAPAVG